MNIRNSVRALATVSLLALVVVSLPVAQVRAASNDDNGIVMDCLNKSTGEWTLSGQVDYVTTSDGKTHAVGCEDGHWVDLGVVGARTAQPFPVRPLAPHPIANALGS